MREAILTFDPVPSVLRTARFKRLEKVGGEDKAAEAGEEAAVSWCTFWTLACTGGAVVLCAMDYVGTVILASYLFLANSSSYWRTLIFVS